MSKLVSIGLPVRNAGSRVTEVVRSVMAQTHTDLELVISDNGSTDDTEDVCRTLAKEDDRIHYHRQPENIGLLNNFRFVMGTAREVARVNGGRSIGVGGLGRAALCQHGVSANRRPCVRGGKTRAGSQACEQNDPSTRVLRGEYLRRLPACDLCQGATGSVLESDTFAASPPASPAWNC